MMERVVKMSRMTMAQAVLFGFALLAGAVLAVGFSTRGEADNQGPWQISAGSNQTAWRVNTQTGATWFCAILAPSKPGCQPASDLTLRN
jgi:hypothetical protein